MFALYGAAISFTLLLIVSFCYFIHIVRTKKAEPIFYFTLTPLIIFLMVLVFIFDYDVVQHQLGNAKEIAGSCETNFVNGGKNLDTTEIVMNDKTYKIKSDEYQNLEDGYYECKLTYAPITKFVLEAIIE